MSDFVTGKGMSVLRALWRQAERGNGLVDCPEFRAVHGEWLDELDQLVRFRFVAREGESYRLTVLGLRAIGDKDTGDVLALGEQIFSRLFAQYTNPRTRKEHITVESLAQDLRLDSARLLVFFRTLADAVCLWCSQWTSDFAAPGASLVAGEGVHRFRGVSGVLQEMERWQEQARIEDKLVRSGGVARLLSEPNATEPSGAPVELETPSSVTLPWLVRHVPVGLWLSAAGFIVAVFVSGIYVGQVSWVKQLAGVSDGKTTPKAAGTTPDCSRLISTDGPAKATVNFRNYSSTRAVSVYWVNYQGATKFEFDIAPKGNRATNTFIGHSWCARDANTAETLVAMTVASEDQDVVIP
jgi:VHL beta domain